MHAMVESDARVTEWKRNGCRCCDCDCSGYPLRCTVSKCHAGAAERMVSRCTVAKEVDVGWQDRMRRD